MITIYQPLIQPSQFKKVTCDGHQVVTARELAKIKIVPSELQQLLSFDESLDDYLGWLRLVIKLVKRVKNFQHSIKSRILTFTSWFSFKKKVEIKEVEVRVVPTPCQYCSFLPFNTFNNLPQKLTSLNIHD